MDILMEAVAPNAFHDSGASFDKPKCHPYTRVKILEIIMHWIIGENKDAQASKQFMWLNGAAGCGKSSIAQSTIESCIERGVLLASFFFSRSDPTRNHAGSLVATLAYQVYCAFPETQVQTEILSAIKKDPLIFKKKPTTTIHFPHYSTTEDALFKESTYPSPGAIPNCHRRSGRVHRSHCPESNLKWSRRVFAQLQPMYPDFCRQSPRARY
ncbi:hypothetical protein CPC08DRAFT_786225 [Agrocybe pediades]|nr:hypothetical protein CPC08DRAFT_786225 [Agrocybe pediades]